MENDQRSTSNAQRPARIIERSAFDWPPVADSVSSNEELTPNVERGTPNAELAMEGEAPAMPPVQSEWVQARRPLLDRLDLLNHRVEIRPIATLELGMEKLTIGVDFERSAARRN
jgi:hypothetical protein